MGTYHEPRVPQGAPAGGERDVWLANGKVYYGVWNSGTNQWDIEREEDYQGQTVYSAARLDGQLPSYYALATHTHEGGEPVADTWHKIGSTGEPVWQTGWAGFNGDVNFKKIGNIVYFSGTAISASFNTANKVLFYLPDGYRPPDLATFLHQTPNANPNKVYVMSDGSVRIDNEMNSTAVYIFLNNFSFAV